VILGWHYCHRSGTWNRLAQAEDRDACSRQMERLVPFKSRRTNLHVCYTEGSYPDRLPPHPHGDGVRRDVPCR
jgi:hypothetical protein